MSCVNRQASLEGHHLIGRGNHLIGRGNQATNIGFDHLLGYNGDIEIVLFFASNDDLIAG